MITLQNGSSVHVENWTKEFVDRFTDEFFDPEVEIFIFNETHIDLGDKVCYACYLVEFESVFMPSKRDPSLVEVDYSWKEIYLGFLAHEFVHVEQKRMNKPIQERGVRVRSRTFLESCGFLPVWI